MKGVFLDFDTVCHDGDVKLRPLEKVLSVLRVFGVTPADKLVEHALDAEVLILNKVKLPAEAIRHLPAVKLISVAATGTNNIDLTAAWDRKIGVCNVPGYATRAMAQHVFALLLSLNQHLKGYQALMQEGAWKRSPQFTLLDYPIRELHGKRMGILGYGHTGQAVARVAEAFGMAVFLAARGKDDKRPGRLPLHELLPLVDVLSIHAPLTPETRGLIGPNELTLMKPTAILINCSRGGIVDEQALAMMLRAGRLAGAGIDVLSEEPPVHGNPLLDPGIPNLIVTPHVAWASQGSLANLAEQLIQNIEAFVLGSPRNLVA